MTINNLIVISTGSFPYGQAATNRHISYLKGLVRLGVVVNVFLLGKSTEQSPLSYQKEGIFEGINYEYATFRQNASFFGKILLYIKAILVTRKKVLNFLSVKPDSFILVLSTDPIAFHFFMKIAKKRKVRIFHERTEFPFISKNSIFGKIKLNIYYRQIRKLDGLFVITKALKDFFSSYIDEHKIVHIPMTVEPERFKIEKSTSKYGKYIAYCGSMYTDKDGVPILLNAFDIFADKFRDVNLVLIGDISNKAKISPIINVLNSLKHKGRVYFTGLVERNDMSPLLVNASALALARPNNIQAQGGFPTKLGEYLATGNPVVVTKVGEIPNYLKHLVNAYIAQPDSEDDFADKIEMLFSNIDKAKEIGLKGQELAFGVFNYKLQAKNLLRFFQNNGQ